MASNDDVLTDEQIRDQLDHFKLLESQRTRLKQEAEKLRQQEFLRDYIENRLEQFLYHNDVKGDELDAYNRYLRGETKEYDYDTHYIVRKDLFSCYDEWCNETQTAKHRKVYAFSLTTPDSDASAAICEAAIKLFEQKSVPISEGECYLEYGSTGYLPHVHGWYETEHGGRVFTKVFKRVWPLWGEDRRHHTKFRGGYHELVKNPQAYNLYASAEQRLIVRKRKSEPLVYGQTHPSSSLAEAQPQEEASAQDAQNPACDHNQHGSDSGELLSDVE